MTTPSHREVVDATVTAEDTMRPQRVPVNVYEAPNALVVVAPLPAVHAEDVHVELRDRQLRFYAHLRSAAPRDYLVNEWDYGGYERELDLPDGYGADIEVNYVNGQLTVRVLKGEFTEVRKARPPHD